MPKDAVFRIVSLVFLAWTSPSGAIPFSDARIRAISGLTTTQVLVLGQDTRRGDAEFAASRTLDLEQLRRDHAASGIVECGDSHGAGQLTLSNDVITTASHVFFDEQGARRAKTCDFIFSVEGRHRRIQIATSTIVVGTRRPYAAKAVHDWAVAKLTQAVEEVAPYELAGDVTVNEPVEFVARGHSDWGGATSMSFEECRLRMQTNQMKAGPREFAFDCNTGDGASGGAVLLRDGHRRLGAILVGWRSDDPTKVSAFSPTNYNFVVSVEGAFRRAVTEAAESRIATRKPGNSQRVATAPTLEEKASRHRSLAPSRPTAP